MNFIKTKNQDGRTVILNVSQITSIWQTGEKTIVSMQHPDDSVTVNEPIDIFAKYLVRCFQIDFGNHLRCKLKVENNQIAVEGAINGWGDDVPLEQVVIVELQ
jgi:hypothetical protein